MNKKFLALIILSLGLIVESCEYPVEPGASTSVSFKINFNKGSNKIESINSSSGITAPSGLKIICIDATSISDSTELSNTLNESMYRTGLRYPSLDTIQNFYDYLNQFLDKKFYGDFTKESEINFNLATDTSKDVSVNPGLNLFLFFLVENNVTVYSGSIQKTIVKNRENVIEYNLKETVKSLGGNVRDATNNKPVSGAVIKLFQDSQMIANTISDEFGKYSFYGIEDGQCITTTTKTGYINISDSVNINQNTGFKNIILSPKANDIAFRIVLDWGKTPLDLDSHLKKANNNISFQNVGQITYSPFAALDIDDVNGYGPETITVYNLNNDSCKFYVQNFSMNPDIKTSNAEVTIYSGSGFLRRYHIPNSGDGLYWYVFDITPTGNIVSKNIITSGEP